jgi:hypothetical protein
MFAFVKKAPPQRKILALLFIALQLSCAGEQFAVISAAFPVFDLVSPISLRHFLGRHKPAIRSR